MKVAYHDLPNSVNSVPIGAVGCQFGPILRISHRVADSADCGTRVILPNSVNSVHLPLEVSVWVTVCPASSK
jgi:hypothetical protein